MLFNFGNYDNVDAGHGNTFNFENRYICIAQTCNVIIRTRTIIMLLDLNFVILVKRCADGDGKIFIIQRQFTCADTVYRWYRDA